MLIGTPLATSTTVKAVIETDLTGTAVDPFIDAAHQLVFDRLAGKGLATELLTQIEIWLSAHFLAMWDARAKAEAVGGEYKVTYEGETGKGLEFTRYGQMAAILDTTGLLSQAGKAKAQFTVNG